MPGGGGGSTSVNVPPQIGEIGATAAGLGEQEQQFLGQGLSLGNYGMALATGGQATQIMAPGVTAYDVTGGTTYTPQGPLFGGGGSGGGGGPPQGAPGSGTGNDVFNYGQLTPEEQQQVQKAFGASNGAIIDMLNSGQGNPGSPLYNTIQQVGNAGRASQMPAGQGTGGGPSGGQFTQGSGGKAPIEGSRAGQGGAITAQPTRWNWDTVAVAAGLSQRDVSNLIERGFTPSQVAQQFGLQYNQTTQAGGVTVPGENPLYGPWINAAVSAIQNEAAGADTLKGMMGEAAQRGQQYNAQGQLVAEQGNQAYHTGTNMLQEATTGTGLYPSQQAYVDASVKAGQSQIAQQLASEGMSASTLGPELASEIGLQGAATAGQLIQGNIASAQAEQGIGVNLQQAAQGWAQLAQGEQTIGFGEQQALTNLFSTIAAQGSSMQNQFWTQGLQGYGLEGAFFNQTLAAYGTSLQAYNSMLQASETQANINAQIEEANTQANAAIISSVISAVGNIASSAVKPGCWVARACFGEDNPRWMLFRFWMVHKAPRWFLRLYTRNGPRWADWIADKPICKAVVRFFMNLVIEYGR